MAAPGTPSVAPSDVPGAAATRDPGDRLSAHPRWLLVGVVLAAFAIRLVSGLHQRLDGDEATLGLAALGITRGHLALMESNFGYNGALEAYVAAPFVAVFGATTLALRAAMAVVGAGYVAAMYGLGRAVGWSVRRSLALAGVAAVFPLFAVTFGVKARWGYAELLLFEALCLAIAVRIGWRGGHRRLRLWVLLGVLAGLGCWSSLLLLIPLAVAAAALLVRAPRLGWRTTWRGGAAATAGAVVGLSPWIAYNATHSLHGLRSLPTYHTGIRAAVRGVLNSTLPIVVGGSGQCGADTVPAWTSDGVLILLTAAVVACRWRSVAPVLRGRLSALQPVDAVLLVAPVALASVTVGRFNGVPCEPRYSMPLAVPLALGLAVCLTARRPWRHIATAVTAGWLVVAGVSAHGPVVDSVTSTVDGALIPDRLDDAARWLQASGDAQIVADYWLARPLEFASGDRLPLSEYNAGSSTPRDPVRRTPDAWLFVEGQATEARFEQVLAGGSITARRRTFDGLVLYDRLGAPIELGDLDLRQ